jgi:S-adenosylmethionine hydrolase
MVTAKIVTLTTDFGAKDPYVAELKAAILKISPDAIIVDITNEIEKFNIPMGAFMLASAAPYFPDGSVHVAVVDPGVGTRRRSIVIQTPHSFFVGPDNGLLIFAAEKQGILRIHELSNPRYILAQISHTFHGRDIFAPVAAHLTRGVTLETFGPEIHDVGRPKFSKIEKKTNMLLGEVLHVDDFGNIITNIDEGIISQLRLKAMVSIELSSKRLKLRFCKAYGEVEPHEPLALIGSHGYLEISVNQGNASNKFKTKAGDKIGVLFTENAVYK